MALRSKTKRLSKYLDDANVPGGVKEYADAQLRKIDDDVWLLYRSWEKRYNTYVSPRQRFVRWIRGCRHG